MDNFTFQNPTKIIFGKGAENQVGKEVSKYSKKILLHYGGGFTVSLAYITRPGAPSGA